MQARRRWHRVGSAAQTLAELLVIALVVWWIGAQAHAFTGPNKGFDAVGHLSKARFIMDNWPHVSWNYEWYSGEPAFSDYPLYHVLLALIATVGGVSLGTAMNAVACASMFLTVAGLYATVRAATGSRVGGLTAAGLLVATPSLWEQVVVLGLYPRFAGLGMMSVALAAAVAHARRGGWWRGALVCVLLALCLSMHPVVGMIGVGLIVGVYLLNPGQPALRRFSTSAIVVVAAFGIDAWFYVPLVLSPRSQTLFTDTETSLSWGMLFHPLQGHLAGLTPWLVPLGLLLSGLAIWQSLPPAIPYEEKVALGRDVTILAAMTVDSVLPDAAGPGIRRYFRWFTRTQSLGLASRMSILFAVSSAAVFGYGLVGLAVPHFSLYINGLQPTDLLVYPAYLLSGIVGLMMAPLHQSITSWLRATFKPVRATALRVAALTVTMVAAASVTGITIVHTADALLPAESANANVPQRAALLPAAAGGQFQYRFAGAADSTTEWVNAYSSVPQTRGYDDHAALHLDWQVWLETSLKKAASSPAERSFLLDWYGVKWVDADSGSGDLSQYEGDPAAYTQLLSWQQPGVDMRTFQYDLATPILSASTAPSLLVVGDDQHYDLILHALALSGVGSRQLIPVHGPASLDDVTPALLRSFSGVALYGAQVGQPTRDAAMLGNFVRAGGGLFVDGAEDSAEVGALTGLPGSPIPVAGQVQTTVPDTGWDWTTFGDPSVVDADLAQFGRPAFANSGGWSTQTSTKLQAWARPVLATGGKDVVVRGAFGAGSVLWEGLNLPYHVDSTGSGPEAAFLARAVLSTLPAAQAVPASTATSVNAEAWRISTTGATGILLKVQDDPGWHATVNGAKAAIYPAGPGMMWIPTGGGALRVEVKYHMSSFEELGFVGTFLTCGLILVLLLSRRARRVLVRTGGLAVGPTVPLPRRETVAGRSRAWEPLPLDFGS